MISCQPIFLLNLRPGGIVNTVKLLGIQQEDIGDDPELDQALVQEAQQMME